jgi:RNA polymerase sigma-70 factor (ECF subfamily)
MRQPERIETADAPVPPEPLTEGELLACLRREPASVIGDVLMRFERPLLRYARSLTGSHGAAQDVVQDAFLRLLHKVHSVRDLSAWLGRVTHNLAMDHLRREARMKRAHEAAALVETAAAPPAAKLETDGPPHLHQELGRLSVNERAVIVLKVVEGRSYKEIAAITGLSTSNVGYLIHQGLKKLAARLDGDVNRGGER